MTRRTIRWAAILLAFFALTACSTTVPFDLSEELGTGGRIDAEVASGVATAGRGGLAALGRGGLSMLGVDLGGGDVAYDPSFLGDVVDTADLHDTLVDVGVQVWLAPFETAHFDDPSLIKDPSNLLFRGSIALEREPGTDRWNVVSGRLASDLIDQDVFDLMEGDAPVTIYLEFVCRDADGDVIAALNGDMTLEDLVVRVRATAGG
ncbi:MAG: hypothetical protein WD336_09415 [Trueperaceae bacterium]